MRTSRLSGWSASVEQRCCAAQRPVSLSTGLLAVSADAALGAGAVGVGVTAVVVGLRRIRSRRIDAESQSESPGLTTTPDGSDPGTGPIPTRHIFLDRSRKRF